MEAAGGWEAASKVGAAAHAAVAAREVGTAVEKEGEVEEAQVASKFDGGGSGGGGASYLGVQLYLESNRAFMLPARGKGGEGREGGGRGGKGGGDREQRR